MNVLRISQYSFLRFLLFICLPGFYACEKSEKEPAFSDSANVTVNLEGVETDDEGLATGDDQSKGQRASASQSSVIPFSKDISIFATMTSEPMRLERLPSASPKAKPVSRSAAGADALSAIVRQPLAANIRYRVLVYDSAGTYVTDKIYNYGSEATTGGFALNAGKSYRFITFSTNSTTTLPAVTNINTLATATINNLNGPLMYSSQTIRLAEGANRLNIILKHQFSELTTKIDLDATTVGNITAINSTTIKPAKATASINLSTGVITYGADAAAGAPVTFPGLGAGVRTVTSNPSFIMSQATTSAVFNIGSITINGTTKGDLALNNIIINPGRRYTLNLKFQSPCTIDVTTGNAINFNVPENSTTIPPSATFAAPAADYGFVFDITRIDNSFNMTINGTSLIRHNSTTVTNTEIQFQDGLTANYPRNIRFSDGTIWGEGTVPQVYSMTGTAARPVIRVVITGTGDVFMYGSKVAGGELFPLVLFNGYLFNKINWNRTTDNTVRVSQVLTGPTLMVASGSGKRIVPCP